VIEGETERLDKYTKQEKNPLAFAHKFFKTAQVMTLECWCFGYFSSLQYAYAPSLRCF